MRSTEVLRSTEGKGIRKAGARGRKPKGKGRPERQRRLPVPLGCHPRFVGEMTHVIEWSKLGEVIPANSDLFYYAAETIRILCVPERCRKALDQWRRALPANSDLFYYAADTIRILCVPERCRKTLDQWRRALPANSDFC